MSLPEVRGFSELKNHLKYSENRQGCFADTSILFAATYPFDTFSEASVQALDSLAEYGTPAYTNITVRTEYLENHRRILIAECLIDLYEDLSSMLQGSLAEKLKSLRTSYRRKIEEGKNTKIDIGQVRYFREQLANYSLPKGNGWEVFCRDYLHNKLKPIWSLVEEELKVNFFSLRTSNDLRNMSRKPEWDSVIEIMGRYGISSADAMIVNMFLCSKFPILLTADLEMAECTAKESKGRKKIFVPDSQIP